MNAKRILLFVLSFVLFGCGVSNPDSQKPANPDWEYEKTIASPIVEKVETATTLGDLEENKMEIAIPENTFDASTEVTVQNPSIVPAVDAGRFTPLGSPVEVTSSQKRLNAPMTITLKVPEASEKDLKTESVWAVYYNGSDWDMIRPITTDAEAKTITFESYHMSLWGTGKVSVEERVKKYTHSKTLGEMAQEQADDIVDKIVEQAVDNLLRVQLGMSDESAKYKIISSLANDDDYAEILDAFRRNDAEGFNKKLMVFLGKKVAENVEKSALESALKNLSSKEGVEYAEAAAEALGYLYEGDLEGAAEVLGGKIADAFLITKLFKAGGEIVQYNINLWKDSEIEAAYQAYKNGSDDYFWGYNVDKGDFGAVYDQMKGIAVRLESEYVEREIRRRENLGLSPPTDAQLREVREQVRKDLEKQFETRLSKEDELAKEEERLRNLIDAFTKAKLLEDESFGYDDDTETMEERLDNLLSTVKKIVKDTKRKDWTTNTFTDKDNLSVGDLVSLLQAWNSTNGKDLYNTMLKERFGVDAGGIGIQGDFTLISFPDPPTNSWQSQIFEQILTKAKIEVKDGVFDSTKNITVNTTWGPKLFSGTGWAHWVGTYDPATGILSITGEIGWDGSTTSDYGDGKEKIVYTSPTKEVKITPDMKRVSISFIGTITSTTSDLEDGGWTKPWTRSDEGGPTVQFDIEIQD